MVTTLIICLTILNLAILFLIWKLDQSHRDERREYENRIVRPDMIVHKAPTKEQMKNLANLTPSVDEKEYAKVGTIDYRDKKEDD